MHNGSYESTCLHHMPSFTAIGTPITSGYASSCRSSLTLSSAFLSSTATPAYAYASGCSAFSRQLTMQHGSAAAMPTQICCSSSCNVAA